MNRSIEPERIKKLIIYVGNQGEDYYKRDIQKLSENVIQFYKDKSENKEIINETIINSILHFGEKSFIYSIFSILIDQNLNNFLYELINKLIEILEYSIRNMKYIFTKNIMKFFSELVLMKAINHFNYISFLIEFLKKGKNSNNYEFFFIIVIENLYILKNLLVENYKTEFELLICEVNEIYKKIESKDKNYFIDYFFISFNYFINKDFDINKDIKYKQFEDELNNVKQLKLENNSIINLKNLIIKDQCCTKYLNYQMYELIDFKLLNNEQIYKKINIHLLINDSVLIYHRNINFVLKKILKCIEYSTMNEIEIIFEIIFSNILQKNNWEINKIYYYCLGLNLYNNNFEKDEEENNKNENNIEQIDKINNNFWNWFVNNINNYDIKIINDVIGYYGYLFSNNKFKLNFEIIKNNELKDYLEYFYSSFVLKLIDLSYYEFVVNNIDNDDILNYINNKNEFVSNFEMPNHNLNSIYTEYLENLQNKVKDESFLELILNYDNVNDKVVVFIHALYSRAHLSISHCKTYFKRYKNTLLKIIEHDKMILLNTIIQIFENDYNILKLFINNFIENEIYDYNSILNYLLVKIKEKKIIFNIKIYDIFNYFLVFYKRQLIKNYEQISNEKVEVNLEGLEENISRLKENEENKVILNFVDNYKKLLNELNN